MEAKTGMLFGAASMLRKMYNIDSVTRVDNFTLMYKTRLPDGIDCCYVNLKAFKKIILLVNSNFKGFQVSAPWNISDENFSPVKAHTDSKTDPNRIFIAVDHAKDLKEELISKLENCCAIGYCHQDTVSRPLRQLLP